MIRDDRFHRGIFQRAEGLLTAEAGDDLLMMNVTLGRYFNLNPVGARVWALLEKPLTLQALADKLTEEYEVSEPVLFEELQAFLQILLQRELIVVNDASTG